jgi:Holliday junction DNA helicase RuvA
MITSLSGTLIESGIFRAVVECAGVGYEVAIPVTTAEKLPKTGQPVRLHIHQAFREDGQFLFGFATVEERDFFKMLVEKVSGVGPKMAINLFSRLSLPTLKDAIARGDINRLSDCPGIGKKTAERLVVELRDKVGAPTGKGAIPVAGAATPAVSIPTAQQDALDALVALGFKANDADKALRAALAKLGADAPAEKLIRAALGN